MVNSLKSSRLCRTCIVLVALPIIFVQLSARSSASDGSFDERLQRSLAEAGNLPAIEEMARRLLTGDGLERDRGESWYWLKRAQQNGSDLSSITSKSLNELLGDLDAKERVSLAAIAHAFNNLDMHGIDIPAAFAPLTEHIPKPLSDEELALFAEKFREIRREENGDAYNAATRELVARAAGLRYLDGVPIDNLVRPLGMSNDEFVRRKCNYRVAAGTIFPTGRDDFGHLLGDRRAALASLFDRWFVGAVDEIVACVHIAPNPDSAALLQALTWAKGLRHMTIPDLRQLADEHREKSGSASRRHSSSDLSDPVQRPDREKLLHHLLAKTIYRYVAHREGKK